jgi:hypothetical protein
VTHPTARQQAEDEEDMSKQKVSAKSVVADIRSGISDDDLMEKYNLTPKGLESLFAKLIEKNIVTASELAGRGQVQAKGGETERQKVSPRTPERTAEPALDPKLAEEVADQVRRGTHKNELMVKFGLSPSQLQNLMENLVLGGYLSAEEIDAGKARKTKPCPHCAGTVAEGDTSCTHCGQDPNQPISPGQDDPPDPNEEPIYSEGVSYEKYCAWEDRGNQGTVQGYIQTASKCLLSPEDFFSRLPLNAGYFSPILFSAMSVVVAVLFMAVWFQILRGGVGALGLFGLIFLLSITFVLSVISIPVGLFVWSLLTHGVLVLLRGAQSGFQATFRVACYSSVTSVFSAIPVVGNIASLWGLYLSVVGLRETHETTTGKAAGAVLIPFSVLVLAGILFGGVFSHSGTGAKATQGHKTNTALQQRGEALPPEICTAIESFTESVDTAMTRGTVKDAQPGIRAAMEELDRHVKKLADQQRANEVRQKAAAFAMTNLTIMAFQEKLGTTSVPNAGQKLEESRASLNALCGR